jgi:hypothetical protein
MRARDTAEMFGWIEGFFAAAEAGEIERWAETARLQGRGDEPAV